MNTLDVKLEPDLTESNNGKLYLKVNLTIDDRCPLQVDEDDFDIVELVNSSKQSGTYFIWTCSCGVAGCAGYFKGFEVKIGDDVTVWEDNDLGKKYEFRTADLNKKIKTVYEDVLKWHEQAKSTKMELNIWPSWTMDYLIPAIK